jgi:Zn-dependent protease with chaperone function
LIAAQVCWRKILLLEKKSAMGFAGRTLLLLSALYGMVFVLGDLALLHGKAPLWAGVIFAAAIIGLQYLLSPWLIQLCYSINWDHDAAPAPVRAFVERMCREHNLPQLKIGVIESGTPNAFAFGRVRSDARIVVTRGLLDSLTQEETNAVLAHEIGHVAHLDFAVMAVAAMAPLLLWQIYIWTRRVNQLRVVSYAAYASYWAGQFMVLMLNRTREYGADAFSAHAVHAPNALSSALVKIAYGMVRERSEAARLVKQGDAESKKDARRSLEVGRSLSLMGIMSATSNENALALSEAGAEDAARVMRWDLESLGTGLRAQFHASADRAAAAGVEPRGRLAGTKPRLSAAAGRARALDRIPGGASLLGRAAGMRISSDHVGMDWQGPAAPWR